MKQVERIKELLEKKKQVCISGISGSAFSYLYSNLISLLERPNLIVLPTKGEAERIYKELRFFLPEKRIYRFFPYDISPFSGLSPHKDIISERISSLYSFLIEECPIVITCLSAIVFKTIPKDAFVRFMEYIEKGEELERERLIRKLEEGTYQRVPLVEDVGDYAVRGNIIDIFTPNYPNPIRIEFWADTVESIRMFDPVTQRSIRSLESAVIVPCSEVIMNEETLKRARSFGRIPSDSSFPGKEAWLIHFYERPGSVFDYLPEETLITVFSFQSLQSQYKRVKKKFFEEIERFKKEAGEKGELFPETEGLILEFPELKEKFSKWQKLKVESIKEEGEELVEIKGDFSLEKDEIEISIQGKGKVSLAPLAQKLSEWVLAKGRAIVVLRTKQQAERLEKILENYGVRTDGIFSCWKEVPEKSGLFLCIGHIPKGFVWKDAGILLISEDEIFGRKKEAEKSRKLIPWTNLSEFREGDLVVHEEHGIGRYMGLMKMEINGKVNDFAVIEYAGGSKLYIPADRISILQKYIGSDDREPKLDQLGGRSWEIAKKRAKSSARKIAKKLVELYAIRKASKGFAFSPPDHVFREFEATFEHEETPDQIKAIEDVLNDMTSEKPMDRLICGDVGFGKTEVAIRAAFKAVMDGKQVAVIVPTTLLAEQHYRTFKKRMEPYSIKVEVLSRFKTKAEQKRIIAELRSGKIDIIIGTHRILQKDVRFADLGLLIIDEEHRFGVKQKELLKEYRATVDVLSLTATPIPRTLQMALLGIRDISIIQTPPPDRLSIKTHISYFDESLIAKAIRFELKRGGQVFFVHNRVQTIEQMAERLKKLVPEARYAIAHGKMKEKELEETMMRFLNKQIDVLVCTTIIGSGLDIPSANTIIINEVEKLGLAQIYQLKGRVGRSKEKAYAYLLISDPSSLTPQAEKRLKALMDFSRLGAGFQLAMHDLEIRGGGNILGYAQSGHIQEVGYELYVKMIEQAITELKGEEWHEDVNPEINLNVSAYFPEEYIMDSDVRLSLYRRLSMLTEEEELRKIKDEVIDRFGPMPEEAKNLFEIMEIRIILKRLGIKRLDLSDNGIILTFAENNHIDPEVLAKVVTQRPRTFRFLSENKLRINTKKLSFPKDLEKFKEMLLIFQNLIKGEKS